jgi:chromosome segregation ATPase
MDTSKAETERLLPYEIQEMEFIGYGVNFRITEIATDSRVATCYLRENAVKVCDALNGCAAALAAKDTEIARLKEDLGVWDGREQEVIQLRAALATALATAEAKAVAQERERALPTIRQLHYEAKKNSESWRATEKKLEIADAEIARLREFCDELDKQTKSLSIENSKLRAALAKAEQERNEFYSSVEVLTELSGKNLDRAVKAKSALAAAEEKQREAKAKLTNFLYDSDHPLYWIKEAVAILAKPEAEVTFTK